MQTKTTNRFFVQVQNAKKFAAFRYQYLKYLAGKCGAKFGDHNSDFCDIVFPDKESFEAFEKARKDFNKKLLEEDRFLKSHLGD